jgi:predicted aconitase with swiveling domain
MMAPLTLNLDYLTIGPVQSYRNLALVALLTEQEAQVDYLILDEALAQQVITITETDVAGEVPRLRVINLSDQKVLLLDGEELVGAKQNRVLNTSILLAPRSETLIPVSCIERGRWSYKSREFRSPGRTMSADLRKKKNLSVHFCLRHFGEFHSNQGEIWEEIAAKFAQARVEPSPTQALSDLYEIQRHSFEEYLPHFTPLAGQVGFAAHIHGKLAGVEVLGRVATLHRLHGKLVGSYILDALESAEQTSAATPESLVEASSAFLTEAALAPVERRPSVALGEDIRVEATTVVGAGLEFEGQILQLSLFPRESSAPAESRTRPLRQASRRRGQLLR